MHPPFPQWHFKTGFLISELACSPLLVKGNYQARVSLPLKGCTSVSVTNKNKFQSQKKIGRKRRRRRKRLEISQPETMTAGLVVPVSLVLISPSLPQQKTARNLHATIAFLQAAKQTVARKTSGGINSRRNLPLVFQRARRNLQSWGQQF